LQSTAGGGDAPATVGTDDQATQTIGNDSEPDPNKSSGTTSSEAEAIIRKLLRMSGTASLIDSIQMPQSFLLGTPIGEWHLTVGNPMNPIAMIGNLICESVTIDFSDKLGPDDFPAELTATYTLKHARDRERGEIESMFNRGDGRLYESTLPTSASSQSNAAFGSTDGTVRTDSTPTDTVNGQVYTDSAGGSQGPVTP
jgi:hypothetical protein